MLHVEEARVAMDDVPEGVGRTAVGMALVRSGESGRPDALFDDPFAAAFVAAAPDAFAEEEADADAEVLGSLGAVFAFYAVIRTRFYDDYLRQATTGCRQVVLLAAGLDTRAFRLTWPPTVRVWELDLADVLAFKERVLTERGAHPRCDRRTLAADLRGDWPTALTTAGFNLGAPTAWLIEGLLTYLYPDEAAQLLLRVTELSAAGSRVAFEQDAGSSSALLARARSIPSMARYTSMFHGGLGDDAVGWLTDHGWDVEIHDRLEVAAAYGRAAPADTSGGFITATRR